MKDLFISALLIAIGLLLFYISANALTMGLLYFYFTIYLEGFIYTLFGVLIAVAGTVAIIIAVRR